MGKKKKYTVYSVSGPLTDSCYIQWGSGEEHNTEHVTELTPQHWIKTFLFYFFYKKIMK